MFAEDANGSASDSGGAAGIEGLAKLGEGVAAAIGPITSQYG